MDAYRLAHRKLAWCGGVSSTVLYSCETSLSFCQSDITGLWSNPPKSETDSLIQNERSLKWPTLGANFKRLFCLASFWAPPLSQANKSLTGSHSVHLRAPSNNFVVDKARHRTYLPESRCNKAYSEPIASFSRSVTRTCWYNSRSHVADK